MPHLTSIRRSFEQRNAPLLAEARAQAQRLTDAIALGTVHARRCKTIRGHVRRAIRFDNAAELRAFLNLWAPAIDLECRSAERSATLAALALDDVPQITGDTASGPRYPGFAPSQLRRLGHPAGITIAEEDAARPAHFTLGAVV